MQVALIRQCLTIYWCCQTLCKCLLALQVALQPLKRKLSSRILQLGGELEHSEAQGLLEHALLELLSNNAPPIRLSVLRSLQINTAGVSLRCQDPNCQKQGCQGNRIEVCQYRLFEQPPIRTVTDTAPAASSASSSHLQVTPAALDIYEQLEPRVPWIGTMPASGSGSADSEDGFQSADEADGNSPSDADAPDAAGGSGIGGPADVRVEAGPSGMALGPHCKKVAGRWCVSRMRIVAVHHKTQRSHKAINIPLPFSLARSLLWYTMYARPVLMDRLGGPTAHNFMLVIPGSGRPMEQARALTNICRSIQVTLHKLNFAMFKCRCSDGQPLTMF